MSEQPAQPETAPPTPPAPASAMPAADTPAGEHPPHQVNALAIFAWLVLLTAAEVGVVYVDMPKHLLVTALIGSAVLKALLVAIFFMHLKFEGKLIWAMVIGSLILGAVFLLGLCPDMVFSSINLFR